MIFAVAALTLAQAGAPSLQVKLGDEWTARLEQSFFPDDLPDSREDELFFEYELRVRISARKSEGFDFESTTRLVRQRSSGEELPPVKDLAGHVQTLTVSPAGARLFEPGRYDSPIEFRLGRLLWFAAPPEQGQKEWTYRWPSVPGWAPQLDATFKYAGRTERLNRKCARYNVRYTESEAKPFEGSGHLEIDEELGIPLAAEITSQSVSIPGGEGRFRLKQKVEVTSLRLRAR